MPINQNKQPTNQQPVRVNGIRIINSSGLNKEFSLKNYVASQV